MTNIELKDILDENKDSKINNKDLIALKENIDKLWINIELKALEDSAIDNAIQTKKFIPQNFRQEILKIDNKEEKKMLVFLFQFWEKILWQESLNELAKDIPLNEVILFLSEIIEIEKKENLMETATIVLTLDEIKELKEKILVDYTKEKLKKFVEEQLNENISSSEAIKWTKFAKTLEKARKNPVEYMKNIDKTLTIFFTALTSNIETWKTNISKDTLHNMWTWLSIAFLQFFAKNKDKVDFNFDSAQKAFEIISNTYDGKNIAINFVGAANKIANVIKENFDKEWLPKSENNDILMNPIKFSKFIMEVYKNNLGKWDILSKLQENQKTKHAEYKKQKVIEDIQNIFNSKDFENIKAEDIKKTKSIEKTGNVLNQLKWGLTEIKKEGHKWIENNKETLKTIKETAETLGIWETIKKIINTILKWLGFENEWDDIEDKLETNTSLDKYVVDYLKNKTNFENIEKEKTLSSGEQSIFYKWFENNLKDNSKEKISQIKVTWQISWKTMYYLSSLGTNKDSINNWLDTFFKADNFKQVLKKANIKEEDFYKKVFSTKKEKNDKWIETNVGIINMEELSKVIEKAYEKEIEQIIKNKAKLVKEKYTSKKWITLDKLPKEQQEKIKAIWANEEKKFASLVQSYFPNISNFSYNAYISWIGYVETRNRYNLRNGIWATWKYQFMPYVLKDYWIYDIDKFKKDPVLQEQIMTKYTEKQFKQIINKIKNKVKTDADIAFYLAESHLWWAGAVLKNRSDGNISQNKYATKAAETYNDVKNQGTKTA